MNIVTKRLKRLLNSEKEYVIEEKELIKILNDEIYYCQGCKSLVKDPVNIESMVVTNGVLYIKKCKGC